MGIFQKGYDLLFGQADAQPQPNSPYRKQSELSTDTFPDWYISVSFSKSSSASYEKAVALAKASTKYHEQVDNGVILHQAIYSAERNDFMRFVMLYDLVGDWKSAFVMINGKLIDKKIIGKIKYCYGDKCRSGKPNFCYGASIATENPFGCHRLQISNFNTPWWKFYEQRGNMYYLNRENMLSRINAASEVYYLCPCFNYNRIIDAFNRLPNKMTEKQMQKEIEKSRLVADVTIKV